ncbi:SDR family oxidoreductase [Massilia sp. P8910]|uniref:SDR family oxidoreductase n=1 Tax=Massilia antarctica TaxID=2765360 RepID=UPI0006BB743F|nr:MULTISPECIES: SDR family oxidoreductase [Massilia]MCE3607839.1 SDR family oxidoreductase [Massilia antarctica]MCY0911861.1 SDR family oxidoreductase [Massilia sp. H27-R4]CUI06683.1 FolM Alternative dihydrofolate reductase 1 [Janthinobacterium sp. CG23_2]CUU30469.1 FolM Alternative dihydrofolate reductase 1 [Janthinobacterium sp. CG23_2]
MQQPASTARQPVALVTGAGRRIGRAIALGLARAGWDVALHYRSSEAEAREVAAAIGALGRRAALLQCDLADEAGVRALLPRAAAELGPVGCVVNNASQFDYDSAADFSPALLASHMQTNVAAPILLARALHAATPAGEQAVVINLLDQKLYNLNPDFLSYTLSKAALHTATSMLAQALAPTVRVVGVAPGITMLSGEQTEAGFARAHRATPLGQSSTPDDIVAAVCYLAGARAVTGTTLVVDGGQHLMPLARDVMFLTK